MQKALQRLPPRLVYDRMFRHRRAMQCSLAHQLLPPHEQTKPEEVGLFRSGAGEGVWADVGT